MKEIILNRKKIYILPTVYGLLFIFVLLGMLMGSVNYNNNLGFLLTFLLGGISFVSILHTLRNLLGIQIIAVNAAPVFAGDKAVFDFTVRCEKQKRCMVSFCFSKEFPVISDLFPDKDNHVEISIPTLQRGILKTDMIMVSSCYPLGLFRAWSKIKMQIETLVYPAQLPAKLIFSGGKPSGQGESSSSGSGVEDFEGLKNYQPGDPLNHVSWKTFSRGQGLFVKSFVGQSGSQLTLDWNLLKETDVEHKLSMLCTMALKAHNLRMIYAMNLPGQTIEPSSGDSHKHRCLRALALY